MRRTPALSLLRRPAMKSHTKALPLHVPLVLPGPAGGNAASSLGRWRPVALPVAAVASTLRWNRTYAQAKVSAYDIVRNEWSFNRSAITLKVTVIEVVRLFIFSYLSR